MNRPTHPAICSARRANRLPFTILGAALAALASGTPAQNVTSVDRVPKTFNELERRIVVSFPDHKLALLEGDRVIKIYNVAVGAAASPSPSGEFLIVQRLEDPTYYKPGVVIGPGAANPLGPRWIGLNIKGFGIHGTNRPNSIGKNSSHGCIRLRNADIKDLFERVQVGDRVSLVAERSEEIAGLFGESPRIADSREILQAKDELPAAHENEQQGSR
jgi:lipoprotein-anchoring transpeptidase ErfK/SrfK